MSDRESYLKKFQKELSAGTVSLVLLAVLGQASEPMYGYQIAKRLEATGDSLLSGKQSALYPVLRNLEGAGLLESFVERFGSPPISNGAAQRQVQSGPPRRVPSGAAQRATAKGEEDPR